MSKMLVVAISITHEGLITFHGSEDLAFQIQGKVDLSQQIAVLHPESNVRWHSGILNFKHRIGAVEYGYLPKEGLHITLHCGKKFGDTGGAFPCSHEKRIVPSQELEPDGMPGSTVEEIFYIAEADYFLIEA